MFFWKILFDVLAAAVINHLLTFPCLAGFLLARYRRGKWGWYILGVLLKVLTCTIVPRVPAPLAISSVGTYLAASTAFGVLFLYLYYRAIKCEIRRRETVSPPDGPAAP